MKMGKVEDNCFGSLGQEECALKSIRGGFEKMVGWEHSDASPISGRLNIVDPYIVDPFIVDLFQQPHILHSREHQKETSSHSI